MTWLLLIGVLAGVVTTLSGFGGGLLALLAVSLWMGPHAALAVTTPAMLVGNLDRWWRYRADLDRVTLGRLSLGLVPGALVGGLFAVRVPAAVLHGVMLGVVALSLWRAWGGRAVRLPAGALVGSGLVIGVLVATAGGAGVLAGPHLLALGLTGPRYLATMSAGAVVMHVTRMVGYGATGLLAPRYLPAAAVLALAVVAGNLLGDRLRGRLGPRVLRAAELAAPVLAAGLVIAGAV